MSFSPRRSNISLLTAAICLGAASGFTGVFHFKNNFVSNGNVYESLGKIHVGTNKIILSKEKTEINGQD